MDNDVYKRLRALIEQGDETVARNFLIEHINEVPKEDRDDIIVSLVEEALSKSSSEERALADLRKQGFAIADDIQNAQTKVQDKLKILDLKEKL